MCKKYWQRNKHNSELEEEPSVRTQPFILGIHRGDIPKSYILPKPTILRPQKLGVSPN